MADAKDAIAWDGNHLLVSRGGLMTHRVATEHDLEVSGFVRASRLAAAEAMVEDARKLADWVLPKLFGTEPTDEHVDIHRAACRILASRPSEQASKEDPAPRSDYDTGLRYCNNPGHMWAAQVAPGATGPACPECGGWTQGFKLEHVQELETQLAEAKAELERIRLGRDRDIAALQSQLEAAEAERARYRELLSRVHMWRGSGLPSGLWSDLAEELNRAAAAMEEPQPQPHPQGARLGKNP